MGVANPDHAHSCDWGMAREQSRNQIFFTGLVPRLTWELGAAHRSVSDP